jgi:NlpC/P60 family putative phage cell wall peptidase
MRIDRAAVVAEARSWLGTPYRHQGRAKGVACDCLGLISGVGRALGLIDRDARGYSPSPDGKSLKAACDRYLVPVESGGAPAPGMVALLWVQNRRTPQHMAIVTRLADGRPGLIHAHQMLGEVKEHGLDAFWEKRIVQLYDYPGVVDATARAPAVPKASPSSERIFDRITRERAPALRRLAEE